MDYLTHDDLQKHIRSWREAPYIAVDTEGTLNHPFSETWGLSTAVDAGSEYFGFNHQFGQNLPQSWLPEIKEAIEAAPYLILHHAKHDLRALRNLGIDYQGPFYDTMMMFHMVDENLLSKELDYLGKKFIGKGKNKSPAMEKLIKHFGWDWVPLEMFRSYGDNDASITKALFEYIYPQFQDQSFDGELWDWEQDFTRVLMDMEDIGVLIDQSLCEQELERGLKIQAELTKSLGFNPGSNLQLGKFLLEDLGLPIVKSSKKAGKPSFDKEALAVYDEYLQQMNDSRAREILIYRGWQKTTSSNYKPYLELLDHDGRLRANFKQHGTKTGRLSCETPNLQQIPKSSSKDWNGRLKQAFISDPDYLSWEFDYSQLEFRLAAAYAKEQKLIDAFNDPSRDVFTEMATELGFGRDPTKTLNYTLQYGGGVDRIKTVFGVSAGAATLIKKNYFKKYPGLDKMTRMAKAQCEDTGILRYWTGRKRHFYFKDSDSHKAFNSVCQGGGFEIVKRSSVKIHKSGIINPECQMNLQVHDSLRFDILRGKENTYIPAIIDHMESTAPPGCKVKFRVDVHEWGTENKWKSQCTTL